jgi:hypothetical protein
MEHTMKLLKYLLMAALVAMPLTACDEDDDVVVPETPTGTISGTVSADGTGLSGVAVDLVGASTQSTSTGANGAYTFANVEAGSWGITINAANHPDVSFATTSRTTTITTAGQQATVDFSGSYIRTASITAIVSAGGAPLAGISVAVTGGPENVTVNAVTDAGGQGRATGLRAGNYTVTISNIPEGVEFTTTTQSVTVATGENQTAHFTGLAPEVPATISIQSITQGGAPISLGDVSGQIEIALNIIRGNRPLDKVEVLIGDIVVASQVFAAPLPVAEEEAELETSEVVILNVPTNQVKQGENAKIPVIFNGQNIVTAYLYEVGAPAPIPTNEVPVVMNNPDVLLQGALSHTRPDGVNCVTVSGNQWCTGGTVLSGYEYLSFGTIQPTAVRFANTTGTAVCADPTTVFLGTPPTGQVVTNVYNCPGVEGTVIPAITAAPYVAYPSGSVGPDGSDLTKPTGFSRLGAAFTLGGEDRWFVIGTPPALTSTTLRVDNKAPGVEVHGQLASTVEDLKVAFHDDFSQHWVNASYAFLQDVKYTEAGSGVVSPDGITTLRWDEAVDTLAVPICSTSTEVIVTGADLDVTITSDGDPEGYRLCATVADRLGNTGTSGVSNYFGVDKQAPQVVIWGDNGTLGVVAPFGDAAGGTPVSEDMDVTIYGSALMTGTGDFEYATRDAAMEWGLDAIDDRSGLDALTGYPFWQMITRADPTGLDTIYGETDIAALPLANNWRRIGAGTDFLGELDAPGIYTYQGYVIDRAGNKSETLAFNWLVDEDETAGPTVNAITLAATEYTPGEAGSFNVYGSDDLEVITANLWLVYPTAGGPLSVLYDSNTLADRWDNTFKTTLAPEVVTADPIFGRIDFTDTDGTIYADAQGFNDALALDAEDADFLPTSAEANLVEDAGMNPATVANVSVNFIDYAFGGWTATTAAPWPAADIIHWIIEDVDGKYVAEHMATTSIVAPYFDQVLLALNNGGEIIICAANGPPAFNDNGINRFYTYTFEPLTGDDVCGTPPAGAEFHAIGVKGDALLVTDTSVIPIEPEEEETN